MPKFDWNENRRDKDSNRAKLAGLPLGEKFRTLDRLRERDQELSALRPPKGTTTRDAVSNTTSAVVPTAGEQSGAGTIHLRVFGANVTLANASTDPQVFPARPKK